MAIGTVNCKYYYVVYHFMVADICAELAALKVSDTLTHLKVQHASNEVRHTYV